MGAARSAKGTESKSAKASSGQGQLAETKQPAKGIEVEAEVAVEPEEVEHPLPAAENEVSHKAATAAALPDCAGQNNDFAAPLDGDQVLIAEQRLTVPLTPIAANEHLAVHRLFATRPLEHRFAAGISLVRLQERDQLQTAGVELGGVAGVFQQLPAFVPHVAVETGNDGQLGDERFWCGRGLNDFLLLAENGLGELRPQIGRGENLFDVLIRPAFGQHSIGQFLVNLKSRAERTEKFASVFHKSSPAYPNCGPTGVLKFSFVNYVTCGQVSTIETSSLTTKSDFYSQTTHIKN